MGSLMVGWDSPIMDEKKARLQRNKSLTRDEINAFWRSRSQRTDNDRDMNLSPYGSPINSPGFLNETDRRRVAPTPFSRSQTDVWLIVHSQSVPNSPRYTSGEEMASTSDKTDWWTRSSSAFLNEPPRDEMYGMAHKYTAQNNVARLATGNA